MTRTAAAMLWESWMMTRWAFLSRLCIALAFIVLFITLYETREAEIGRDDLLGLRMVCSTISLLCVLSGIGVGRSQDGRSGFPFNLGFWRPAPTWLQVIVPMTYRTVCCTALYAIPTFVTHLAYGVSDVTRSSWLLVIPIILMTIASSWWTDKKGINQLIGWVTVFVTASALIYFTLHFNEPAFSLDPNNPWWQSFSFTLQDYSILLLVAAAAVVITLVGVQRQRHGDDGSGFWPLKNPKAHQTGDDWLTDLYQTECPTTSPKRAELWSEINSQGLPVIVWSLVAAVTIPTLWLLSNLLDSSLLWWLLTLAAINMPLVKATPNFSIRMKHGSAYLSTFDATRPLNTAWLVSAKLGVAVVSMIIGLLLIATSFWIAAPLVVGFIEIVDVAKVFVLDYIATVPLTQFVLRVLVTLVQLSTMIASIAALQAVYVLYTDRLTFTLLGLLLYPVIPPILIKTEVVPLSFGLAHIWIVTGLIAVGAVYFLFSLAKNRILNSKQVAVFVLISLFYGLAYFYLLRQDGLFEEETPLVFIAFRAGICLLSPAVFALAPWSFARVRHR